MGLKADIEELEREVFTSNSTSPWALLEDIFMNRIREKFGDSITVLDMNEKGLKEHSKFLIKHFTDPDSGQVTFHYCYRKMKNHGVLLFVRRVIYG